MKRVVLVFFVLGSLAADQDDRNGYMIDWLRSFFDKTDFREDRIFGGKNAVPGSAPYQVSLRSANNFSQHYCGGSFISKCHILTAAHCRDGCAENNCMVGYNDNTLSEQSLARVSRFIPHPEFRLVVDEYEKIKTINNDIAIVRLRNGEYPDFGETMEPIEMSRVAVPWGSKITITGWGHINRHMMVPQQLQVTTLRVVSCPVEQKDWGQYICSSNLYSGTCPGDSGGPMIFKNKLVGITSFGQGCEVPMGNYGFSDVGYYMDWITRTMKRYPCN